MTCRDGAVAKSSADGMKEGNVLFNDALTGVAKYI